MSTVWQVACGEVFEEMSYRDMALSPFYINELEKSLHTALHSLRGGFVLINMGPDHLELWNRCSAEGLTLPEELAEKPLQFSQ